MYTWKKLAKGKKLKHFNVIYFTQMIIGHLVHADVSLLCHLFHEINDILIHLVRILSILFSSRTRICYIIAVYCNMLLDSFPCTVICS